MNLIRRLTIKMKYFTFQIISYLNSEQHAPSSLLNAVLTLSTLPFESQSESILNYKVSTLCYETISEMQNNSYETLLSIISMSNFYFECEL